MTRASKAAAGLQQIVQNMNNTLQLKKVSQVHSHSSSKEDEMLMVSDLRNLKPFNRKPGRCHPNFKQMEVSPTSVVDMKGLFIWLEKHKKNIAMGIQDWHSGMHTIIMCCLFDISNTCHIQYYILATGFLKFTFWNKLYKSRFSTNRLCIQLCTMQLPQEKTLMKFKICYLNQIQKALNGIFLFLNLYIVSSWKTVWSTWHCVFVENMFYNHFIFKKYL